MITRVNGHKITGIELASQAPSPFSTPKASCKPSRPCRHWPMAARKGARSTPILLALFLREHGPIHHAFVEFVSARPGEGAGWRVCLWARPRHRRRSDAARFAIPVSFITPASWKRCRQLAPRHRQGQIKKHGDCAVAATRGMVQAQDGQWPQRCRLDRRRRSHARGKTKMMPFDPDMRQKRACAITPHGVGERNWKPSHWCGELVLGEKWMRMCVIVLSERQRRIRRRRCH